MAAKETLFNIIIIGLFFLCMLGFAISYTTNNASGPLSIEMAQVNKTYVNFSNSISYTYSTSKDFYNKTISDDTSVSQIFLILPSLWGIAKSLFSLPFILINAISEFIIVQAFGGNTDIRFLVTVLNGLFFLIVVLIIWEIVRQGRVSTK